MLEGSTGSLGVFDRLATDLLEVLSPLRFEEARDDQERRVAYRLRYAAVVERDLAGVSRFPDGEERDDDDERAIQILGWEAGRAIASCRLVLPRQGMVLPVEAAFDLRLPDASSLVEVGRLVVSPSWRTQDHKIVMGLVARGWKSLRERGFNTVVGATPARLVEVLREVGFAVTVLGTPRVHWNEQRIPILCDGAAAAPRLAQRWGGAATTRVEGP
jgi:N-acyl-L-homoserine lactone synthetase